MTQALKDGSAAAAQGESQELALTGRFEGVTLRKSETSLTFDVSDLNRVDVTIITGGTVQLKAPAREQTPEQNDEPGVLHASVEKRAYKIGEVLPDGWVVGPVSPETGIIMAIEPVSCALRDYQTWYQGEDHAAKLRGQGHANARQPTSRELKDIDDHVVKAGHNKNAQFSTSSYYPLGKYWTSKPDQIIPFISRTHDFGIGFQLWDLKIDPIARVRCVRDEPGLTLA